MCAYQGVRNVSFSENFAYVLNEWTHPECVGPMKYPLFVGFPGKNIVLKFLGQKGPK